MNTVGVPTLWGEVCTQPILKRRDDIAFHMRNRTFSDVYVFQRLTVDAETGKQTLREGDDLGPEFVLEPVDVALEGGELLMVCGTCHHTLGGAGLSVGATGEFKVPTPEMLAYAKKVLEKPASEKPWHAQEKLYANMTLRAEKAQPDFTVPLQAFRIGELGIAATPIETFVEVGLEIKEKTPFPRSFTISIANGAYGYMPTVEQHKLGGYESWLGTNRVEFEAAPKMVTNLLAMLKEMR